MKSQWDHTFHCTNEDSD